MKKNKKNQIKTAVIGGSGAYHQSKSNWGTEDDVVILDTPFGKSAPAHIFHPPDGRSFIFMSRHGETGYNKTAPFVNYRANIWALKEMGIERIFSWSGPGSINRGYRPGDYVLPHDLLDFTKTRVSTFFTDQGLGFIRMSHPFCPQGRLALAQVLTQAGKKFHPEGVYLCTEGPRLETPSEIKYFSLIGADMVGMTLIPEAFLARELEMCYSSLCYITNYAEGIKSLPFKSGELFEGGLPEHEASLVTDSLKEIGSLLPQIVTAISQQERSCLCKDAMLRYKKRGDIGEDWRKWIKPDSPGAK